MLFDIYNYKYLIPIQRTTVKLSMASTINPIVPTLTSTINPTVPTLASTFGSDLPIPESTDIYQVIRSDAARLSQIENPTPEQQNEIDVFCAFYQRMEHISNILRQIQSSEPIRRVFERWANEQYNISGASIDSLEWSVIPEPGVRQYFFEFVHTNEITYYCSWNAHIGRFININHRESCAIGDDDGSCDCGAYEIVDCEADDGEADGGEADGGEADGGAVSDDGAESDDGADSYDGTASYDRSNTDDVPIVSNDSIDPELQRLKADPKFCRVFEEWANCIFCLSETSASRLEFSKPLYTTYRFFDYTHTDGNVYGCSVDLATMKFQKLLCNDGCYGFYL